MKVSSQPDAKPVITIELGCAGTSLPSLCSLVSAYVDTWYVKGEKWSRKDEDLLSSIRENTLPQGSETFIAYADDEPAGCVLLLPIGESVVEITKLFVSPNHRQLGVARMLMLSAINTAEVTKQTVVLSVHEDNSPAKHLYEQLGFREIEFDIPGFRRMKLQD